MSTYQVYSAAQNGAGVRLVVRAIDISALRGETLTECPQPTVVSETVSSEEHYGERTFLPLERVIREATTQPSAHTEAKNTPMSNQFP